MLAAPSFSHPTGWLYASILKPYSNIPVWHIDKKRRFFKLCWLCQSQNALSQKASLPWKKNYRTATSKLGYEPDCFGKCWDSTPQWSYKLCLYIKQISCRTLTAMIMTGGVLFNMSFEYTKCSSENGWLLLPENCKCWILLYNHFVNLE